MQGNYGYALCMKCGNYWRINTLGPNLGNSTHKCFKCKTYNHIRVCATESFAEQLSARIKAGELKLQEA